MRLSVQLTQYGYDYMLGVLHDRQRREPVDVISYLKNLNPNQVDMIEEQASGETLPTEDFVIVLRKIAGEQPVMLTPAQAVAALITTGHCDKCLQSIEESGHHCLVDRVAALFEPPVTVTQIREHERSFWADVEAKRAECMTQTHAPLLDWIFHRFT